MEERPQSTFNMAVEYLRSIRMILNICQDASMENDAATWYKALYSLQKELCTSMKEAERKNFDERLEELTDEINGWVENYNKGHNSMNTHLRKKLHDIEVELRIILDKSGLQTAKVEDALSAFK